MERPRLDTFAYRPFVLSNGLQCLCIHDPTADKAAASLDVGVGSLLDPPEFLGLAHFTEHMLFYSSAKYPQEDEYSKFVTEHGGHTNAYTAAENTNYSFDINWEALGEGLDRFAQFFICPLISADGVDREINAVDSEHGKNLQLDAWRHLQVAKHCANAAHPWARFSTGNLDTLGTTPKSKGLDVRQAVVDFHAKHYSANLMRLCVLGRHSLDELQALVEAAFTPVPNHNLPPPTFSTDVFMESDQRLLCKVVPVKETHAAEWVWQVPASAPLYRKQPLTYLSHLLGHEGEGSVFSLLRRRGWASSLVSGESGSSLSCTSFMFVRVELTDEGQQHLAEIGAIVFSYIALLLREGVQRGIYDEVAALNRLRFDFRDKPSPYQYTTSLSAGMQHFPPQDLLTALYHVPQEWDPECVQAMLQDMSVDKVRTTWTSKQHVQEATDTEPWYGTQFKRGAIPEEWLQAWREAASHPALTSGELHLPAPNPFIPTDLGLRTQEAAAADAPPGPTVIREVQGTLRMWHRCDLTFPTPKAVLYADWQCPEAYASPWAAVCTRLLVKLVVDALSELSYPAELAGLTYDVASTQYGFKVSVSGYSHKLPVLLQAVLDNISGLQVKDDRFAVMAEQLRKEYANMRFSQPYSHAMYRRELMLNLKRWDVREYEQVLPLLTAQHIRDFKDRVLAQCFVEAMCVGNVSSSEAQAISDQLLTTLQDQLVAKPVFPSQMRDLRALRLPLGALCVCAEDGPDPDNVNSAISVMFQVGPDDECLNRNALLELLVHMSKRDAFNTLRTQQQLGYVVHLFGNHELGVHHLEILIQSSVFGPEELTKRVDGFVQQLCSQLLPSRCGAASTPGAATSNSSSTGNGAQEGTATDAQGGAAPSDEAFRKAVSELTKALQEKPKRLGELAQRWWSEVFFGTGRFDRLERVVSSLQALQPQQLLDFCHATLLDPATRRKAVVAVYGSAAPSKAAQCSITDTSGLPVVPVRDLALFRGGCEVWPSLAGLYGMWRHRQAAPPAAAAKVVPAEPPAGSEATAAAAARL